MFGIVVALLLCQQVFSAEDVAQNKTKRTVAGQVQNYGDRPTVMLYADNTGSSSNFYGPITEVPKQVAAQQVLYEYQQTPTNAYSNVHVNQFYQPVKPEVNTQNHYINEAESVANPVQHSTLIRHGQNVAQVQYPQPAAQSYPPGKYLYVNGRIIYQPTQHIPQPQFKQVASYQFNNPYPQLPQKFVTPPVAPQPQFQPQLQTAAGWGFPKKFQPPQPHQIQQITKPMPVAETTAQQQEEPEEEADDEENRKEEEENDYDEESEDDDDHYYGKYRYEDDDEEQESYDGEEADEEDDSDRGSSRNVPKKHKKKSGKGKNYKYSENYSSSSKYDKPWNNKQGKKYNQKPKMKYTSVKYSKVNGGKPKIERLQGRQSQNVPVIHKQKIFKQKWYVTSTDDTTASP